MLTNNIPTSILIRIFKLLLQCNHNNCIPAITNLALVCKEYYNIVHSNDFFWHFVSFKKIAKTKIIPINRIKKFIKNKKIQHLNLSRTHFKKIGPLVSTIKSVSDHLVRLNLSYIQFLTDENVVSITQHTPHLQSINLKFCKLLTEKCFEILSKVEKMQEMNLSHIGRKRSVSSVNSFVERYRVQSSEHDGEHKKYSLTKLQIAGIFSI
eukprot:Pgem_evm1s5946